MDGAVIEALPDRSLDHPVLVDPALALELRCRNLGPGDRQCRFRRSPSALEPGSAASIMPEAPAGSAATRPRGSARFGLLGRGFEHLFIRYELDPGPASGSPLPTSAASIFSQPLKLT